MDKKRWVLTAIVVTVVVSVLEAIYHSVFLGKAYAATVYVWRPMPQMTKLMPLGWLCTLIISFILVYIYHRGYEGKGGRLAEGIRFGFIVGLFVAIPMAVWTYVMYPLPVIIPLGWFAIGMIDMILAGAIIGLLYKKPAA